MSWFRCKNSVQQLNHSEMVTFFFCQQATREQKKRVHFCNFPPAQNGKMEWFVFGCTWLRNRIKAFRIECNDRRCNAHYGAILVCLFRLWSNLTSHHANQFPVWYSFFGLFVVSTGFHAIAQSAFSPHVTLSILDNSFSLLPGRTKNSSVLLHRFSLHPFPQCVWHCHAHDYGNPKHVTHHQTNGRKLHSPKKTHIRTVMHQRKLEM